jgi:hypothetical protein
MISIAVVYVFMFATRQLFILFYLYVVSTGALITAYKRHHIKFQIRLICLITAGQ